MWLRNQNMKADGIEVFDDTLKAIDRIGKKIDYMLKRLDEIDPINMAFEAGKVEGYKEAILDFRKSHHYEEEFKDPTILG